MRRILILSICLITIITCLIPLLYTGTENPIIYSIEKENPVSPYHADIEAMKRVDINTSMDLLPVMQDLIDFSGTITVNIRMKDLESTNNDLSEYAQKLRSFNNLVVKLDMNKSEIGVFNRNKKLQGDLYRQLANQSESLDALNKLEIRYRNEKDSDGLNSVMLQGEALKKKIQTIRNDYSNVSDKVQNQSKKLGLDVSKEEKAKEEVDQFTRDVTDEQEKRVKRNQDVIAENSRLISFLVEPNNGTYWTSLNFNGFISGGDVSNQVIYILLDNKTYIQTTTDNIGQFRYQKEIEQVSKGMHILSARWKDLTSEKQSLRINTTNSTLTLGIKAEKNKPVIVVYGILSTHNLTVRNVPVDININNQTMLSPITNWKGAYTRNQSLVEGRYLVDATFSNSSYPINNSSSDLYEVISSGTSITSIKKLSGIQRTPMDFFLVAVIVIVIGGITGVVVLFRRRKNIPQPDAISLTDTMPVNSESANPYTPEIILKEEGNLDPGQDFLGLYQEKLKIHGLSDASHYVYLVFLHLIGKDTDLKLLNTMTPREVVARIKSRFYGEIFTLFTTSYELIRYGGYEDENHRAVFEDLMKRADKVIRGKRP